MSTVFPVLSTPGDHDIEIILSHVYPVISAYHSTHKKLHSTHKSILNFSIFHS